MLLQLPLIMKGGRLLAAYMVYSLAREAVAIKREELGLPKFQHCEPVMVLQNDGLEREHLLDLLDGIVTTSSTERAGLSAVVLSGHAAVVMAPTIHQVGYLKHALVVRAEVDTWPPIGEYWPLTELQRMAIRNYWVHSLKAAIEPKTLDCWVDGETERLNHLWSDCDPRRVRACGEILGTYKYLMMIKSYTPLTVVMDEALLQVEISRQLCNTIYQYTA